MVKLPERYWDRDRVDEMQPGTEAYIVPWAMVLDQHGECYLARSASTNRHGGTTSALKIMRFEDGTYGVDLTDYRYDHKWYPDSNLRYDHYIKVDRLKVCLRQRVTEAICEWLGC